MNDRSNPLKTLMYIIIGLVALIVAFQLLGVVFRVISWLVSTILSIVLLVVVVYLVYLLVKWAARNIQ